MKITHSISKQVIDVPNEHAQMLMTQGWVEYKEVDNGLQEERQEAPKKVVVNKPTKVRINK